ncbi:unnamed protein product [Didymodactylos carnosus]|uniref:E3 ubiquitin-protein ligase NRDP1 n=1 Tax=Didymodactylos carnosus TaxID=1234261 RepID=A0A813YI88_9BILA|nr:unnamed protein product [Didymodactylos carnosus]CAF0884708.1 unnamed protein product [Didymodactylos carnosus]CAF3511396.1 unnamed protein product [Didymodactylos carnosus]CAF3670168.1 unnamed protein product [Didymodactylos carnosus]
MGYDVARFPNEIDGELICAICGGVLQDPLQSPDCEHAFCQICINEWLSRNQTCPVDRSAIVPGQLKPVPRILKNLLSRLNITCENEPHGCSAVLKMENLNSHLVECEFNPKKLIECAQGCGLMIPKDAVQSHNCIRDLRKELEEFKEELQNYRTDMDLYKAEVRTLQEFIRVLRINNPTVSTYFEHVENDEVLRWSSSLPVARVTRWGGMISTPDAVLQAVIKRALTESCCPAHVVNELMENAHERHWPQGLSTLETRQVNRRHYESYVCRRIPGKQAVIVLACDNRHMELQMIHDPGIVMIFAHGVE